RQDGALRGEGPGGHGEDGFEGGGVEDTAQPCLRARLRQGGENLTHPGPCQGHVAQLHRSRCHQIFLSAARPPFLSTTLPTVKVSSAPSSPWASETWDFLPSASMSFPVSSTSPMNVQPGAGFREAGMSTKSPSRSR